LPKLIKETGKLKELRIPVKTKNLDYFRKLVIDLEIKKSFFTLKED